ncbi:MAG: flagellar export protein FliJ [Gammaproteobacteria bacterium]|nr:flagellar export protein FliJ [Gammaproteobacteria bacterium]MDH3768841.1 flagellar export protein FliJ [Gammaproteobacteria bacterium]
MSRSRRIQPIANLAAHHEKEATKQLGETQARLDDQEKLLDDLEQYHAEYTTANVMSHEATADPVRLQDYRLFLDRLEHAIVRQHQLIARLRDEFAESHSQWAERRTHRKALDNATDRYAQAEQRTEDRREQEQIEEVSALLRTRKPITS